MSLSWLEYLNSLYFCARTDSGCKRHGYMGHLTKMANDLYKSMDKGRNQEKLTALYNGMFSIRFQQ